MIVDELHTLRLLQAIAISRMIPQSEVLPTVVLVVSDLAAKMAPNRLR